jgi:hypothetical protein
VRIKLPDTIHMLFEVNDLRPIKNLELAFEHEEWMYGYGIGTSSLGVQYVSRWLGEKPPGIGVESGFGTLIVEMGILGLLLWLVWVAAALRACWQVVRGLRGTVFFPVAFAIFWFALLLLEKGPGEAVAAAAQT